MAARQLLTLHAPMARALALPVLRCLEEKLSKRGAGHVWLSADYLPDVVIMADFDDEEGQADD